MHYKFIEKTNPNVTTTYLYTTPDFDTLMNEVIELKSFMDMVMNDNDETFRDLRVFYITPDKDLIKASPTKNSKKYRIQSPRDVIEGLIYNKTSQYNITMKQAESLENISICVHQILNNIVDEDTTLLLPLITFGDE